MGAERIQSYTDNHIITWSGNDDECHDTRHYNGCNGVISVTSNVIPVFSEKSWMKKILNYLIKLKN